MANAGRYRPSQQQANAREAARKRARRAGQRTREAHNPKPPFDWDRAIELLRATLAEVYR